KTFVRKYCSYCGKDNGYHTKTCSNNNANYYEGKRARGPTPMILKYNNFKNNRGKERPRYNNNNRNNGGRRPQNNTRKSFTRRRVNNYKEEKQPEKERSHGQHTNSDEITQPDTANQPKIHLTKSKSYAASYLAQKTIKDKLKLTTYTLNKTSQTSNNQLHVNNNIILEKAFEPNIVTNNVTPQSKNETILSPIQKGNNNTLKKKKVKLPLERKSKQEEVEETLNKVLPSKKGKKKEDEFSKDQLRKMGQIIKQKLNRLDKAILDGEIAKDTKIEQTIQDLNWRLEQINKTYSYTQGLTEEEIEEYLESIQKVTKIKDTDKPAETRREYLYEVLSTLNETNDATIWKHREDIKDL
ncbi:4547_t:CDS:2, partial [Dentiscutata erythropus]